MNKIRNISFYCKFVVINTPATLLGRKLKKCAGDLKDSEDFSDFQDSEDFEDSADFADVEDFARLSGV